LLPIPIILIILSFRKPILKQLSRAATAIIVFAAFTAVCFLPFGLSPVLDGLSWIANFRQYSFESSGSLLLMKLLGVTPYTTRIIGLGGGLLTAILLTRSDSPRRYTLPLIVFMIFGFAVFQPWYLLWILPLLCITEPLWVIASLTALFSLLSPNINNSVGITTIRFVAIYVTVVVVKYIYETLLPPNPSLMKSKE
jgi:hypothetical protein